MRRKLIIKKRLSLAFLFALAAVASSSAQDLYMKDAPSDAGIEPNPDTGPMWVTEDIWVRTAPDPGYQPYPFPEASPPWIPLAHMNPEFRDPKYSVSNYVYVRVRNRGSSASNGTERLKLYWAKASTGLSWPTQWVDYTQTTCGPTKLYGAEITKPRKNAATATAAERDAYRDAILAVGTNPAYRFFGGVDYWHKQNEVHDLGPSNRRGTAAFPPWHREFVNRYEVLLQEFDPTVKLLYWDWTTSPVASTGGFNLDTPTFMGASGAGGIVNIGLPFNSALAPPSVRRNLGGNPLRSAPTAISDLSVLAPLTYGPYGVSPPTGFGASLEDGPHNWSHVYIGGSGGDMSSIPTAARDPFFFLLHGNVDRLWAQWQRDPSSLARLDPATTYGTETGNVNITTVMRPWDGTGTSIEPWTPAGGYIVTKSPTDPSVVSPPIYDTAPLTIPVLQPGEAVVIQIPWYPPNPADFSCFGGDQGHFCLLARIETSTSPPFGMTTPEAADVYANTRNNNNIVWKNVTVVDNFPGAFITTSILIRNIFEGPVQTNLGFAQTGLIFDAPRTRTFGGSFLNIGRMFVDLKPELFKRWREGGAVGRGIKVVGNIHTGPKVVDDHTQTGGKVVGDAQTSRLEIVAPDALIQNITLNPNDTFSVDLQFELPRDYPLRQGPVPELDLIQMGAPGDPDAVVGGQRFVLDFSKLVLVKSGDYWRYRDEYPGPAWTSSHYDDSRWKLGKAEFVFGNTPTTTRYFRHTFDVADPNFYRSLVLWLKRDDGAVVYLNGEIISRTVQRVSKINPRNLRRGKNVIAVELRQDSSRRDHFKNSPRSDDPSFDLELSANRADPGFPPDIAFAGPPNGALFQANEIVPVKLEAEALGDAKVQSVSLYVDGELVGTTQQPPYTFSVSAGSKGSHRLRAVAIDNDQRQSESFLTATVVENVPPEVNLTRPLDGTGIRAGQPISVSAQASDRGGKVKRVEFWVREADSFMSESRLVATATTTPYRASIRDLRPGHYMLWAVAVDDRDGTSQSMPVHIEIH